MVRLGTEVLQPHKTKVCNFCRERTPRADRTATGFRSSDAASANPLVALQVVHEKPYASALAWRRWQLRGAPACFAGTGPPKEESLAVY